MEEISQELALRMAAALHERVRAYGDWDIDVPNYVTEMRAIVALLPEEVDPDLVEARSIALKYALPGIEAGMTTYRTNKGEGDKLNSVQAVLAALKRGRELAKARAGEGSV